MPKRTDIHHSILVVSNSQQFDAILRGQMPTEVFDAIDFRRNAATARRSFPDRYYDIVVINAPLPDETGEEIALDMAEQGNVSVLLVTPHEVYEDALDRVTDQGILVLPKPFPKGRLGKAVRFLVATQNRMKLLEKKLENAQDKLEELRLVSRAKLLLMEQKGMSEEESHRYIGKQAMDHGISRGQVAERILDELE